MVLYKGKEMSQEEFDTLLSKVDASDKLVQGYQTKVNELEEKAKEAEKLGDLRKSLEQKDAEIFKMKLDTRTKLVSKYLESKNNDENLIKKIGSMADDDFELFSEGKTNDTYLNKEEIDSAKNDIDQKKKELETEKDKIIKDAQKSLENKDKKEGQKLIPNSEVVVDDADDNESDENFQFPAIDKLKEIYGLDDSRYDKNKDHENKATAYLKKYNQIDNI